MITRVKGSVLPDYTPLVLARSQALVTVVNTVAESTLASFSLSAAALKVYTDATGPDSQQWGALRIKAFGRFLNNSGGAKDLRYKLAIGATTVLDTGLLNVITSASIRGWNLDTTLTCRDSSLSKQSIHGEIKVGFPVGSTFGSATFNSSVESNILTLDLTIAQNIVLSTLLSAADPNLSMVLDYLVAELV